jgi:CheY-like chemotaxis protein
MANPKKVLVADDEDPFLVSIRDFLEDEGFAVICVDNAQDLLANIRTVDALVVDARLPKEKNVIPQPEAFGGVETISKLLQDEVLSEAIPVIFISVLTQDDFLVSRGRDISIPKERYTWFQKLFELEYLASTIHNQLRLRTGG